MKLGVYRAITGLAEIGAWPAFLLAGAQGGDGAARFGLGEARGATWVHASSVGEVSAAAPLVRAIGQHRPSDDRLVTAGTKSGREAWRRELERRPPGGAPVSVTAWPLDFPGAVRRALQRRAPRRVLIVETEIWPNFLHEALGRGVRVAFANARLSERRWERTRLLLPLVSPLLSRVTACAAQSEADLERWAFLGVPRDALCVTGNTKFDQMGPAPADPERAERRARAGVPEPMVLCAWGSLRPGEEPALIALAKALFERGKPATVVAVPRHPEQAHELRVNLVRAGLSVTDWRPGEPWPERSSKPSAFAADPALRPHVLWVPALGVLREVYGLADVAIVGGTFAPHGGHNAAEPAEARVPVLVGPHVSGIREVVEALVVRGGGRIVVSGREAADQVVHWTESASALATARAAARRAVEDLSGASARTIGFLEARGFWG